MPMIIRRPRLDEADALTDVILRSKRANGYDDAFMALCVDELSVTVERLNKCEYWLADDGGEICGCACLVAESEGESGEIHAFFVDPIHQRKGIGLILWAKLLERAKAQNLKSLHLDSDPFAVPFYQALGFEITGETPSGSIPGRILPLMEYKLV